MAYREEAALIGDDLSASLSHMLELSYKPRESHRIK
jgi:hypothetical protein